MSDDATARERIIDALRQQPLDASALSQRIGIPRSTVYDHLEHVAQSIGGSDTREQLLVSPPECGNCGFTDFDDPVNDPSRCPDCRSENIREPTFTIG